MYSKAALFSLALPVYGAVHESLSATPFGWTQSHEQVSEDTQMQLNVALQYNNIASLESELKSVSDPSSADYGKYMDINDVNAKFAPSSDSESKVKSWLQSAGASEIVSDGNTVSFLTTVGEANKMLDTKFAMYTDGKTEKLRTTAYSVPDGLQDAIDLIHPTTYFGGVKAHAVLPRAPATGVQDLPPSKRQELKPSCETTVNVPTGPKSTEPFTLLSPQCLKELYNTVGYKPEVSSGSDIAFGSFLNESASYSDLAKFEKMFKIPSQNFTVRALINGGVDNQDPATEMDGEANLDVQNIMGLIEGLPVGEYITGGLPPFVPDLLTPNKSTEQNEPYLQYYTYLLSQPNSNLPYVISNSYGDHENTVPYKYANRVCNMIGMMGLRGRTILESSADEGVGAVCRANTGAKQPEFTPQFPPTCPYVTAVGGTQFVNPEHAWNASSGGFSNYFGTAWYQQDAVNTYLSKHIKASTKAYYADNSYVNFAGRGFPDVAAHSLYPDYLTVIDGVAQPNGGTSAASPVTAAIVALLNDARFRAGKPAMGFINPWLYSVGASVLNDITLGGSLGCAGVDLQSGAVIPGAGIIPYASWNATVGWDPVTGLGTPNFMKMKTAALSA